MEMVEAKFVEITKAYKSYVIFTRSYMPRLTRYHLG